MHKELHTRDNVDWLYVSRKEGGRGLASIEECWSINSTTWELHRKTQRTGYSHQKWYWLHDDQQNDNNWETKIGRKTTLWAF